MEQDSQNGKAPRPELVDCSGGAAFSIKFYHFIREVSTPGIENAIFEINPLPAPCA